MLNNLRIPAIHVNPQDHDLFYSRKDFLKTYLALLKLDDKVQVVIERGIDETSHLRRPKSNSLI